MVLKNPNVLILKINDRFTSNCGAVNALFVQFLPMATSYVIKTQFQTQNTDMVLTTAFVPITPFSGHFLCVSVCIAWSLTTVPFFYR
jgi:hypothetical protein